MSGFPTNNGGFDQNGAYDQNMAQNGNGSMDSLPPAGIAQPVSNEAARTLW